MRTKAVIVGVFLISAATTLFLLPLSSQLPDGLETVARKLGFENPGMSSVSAESGSVKRGLLLGLLGVVILSLLPFLVRGVSRKIKR